MRNMLKATTLERKFPLLAVENGCIISKDADITVASLGNGCHYGIRYGCQFGVVAQRVAIHNARTHFLFGHQTESFHTINYIVERTAL